MNFIALKLYRELLPGHLQSLEKIFSGLIQWPNRLKGGKLEGRKWVIGFLYLNFFVLLTNIVIKC